MADFRNSILGIIWDLLNEREAAKKAPVVACENDIVERIKTLLNDELDSLVEEGVLSRHPNLNKIQMYRFKDKDNENHNVQ